MINGGVLCISQQRKNNFFQMGISEDLPWSPQLAMTCGHSEEQKTSTPSALTPPPMRGKEAKAKILTK